ncbi:UPF0488 protein CG14286-like isoform X2 [Limulus polyphemus]|uniref:UPF0488 protein CG14286-like isoform X2 n=1 Tax=Limulus polyphemus TaxID=6850 RepID=A0ABM1SXM5_LIMPO|nr:UPF0488 protein CG14286-like isoform X2 [Limulus polyphemus]
MSSNSLRLWMSTNKRTEKSKSVDQMEYLRAKEEDFVEKFEEELCWCINQLQLSIESKNVSQKQVEDSIKMLKTLQNPKAPLIKKRQVMRGAFGDYRLKMKEDKKKFGFDTKKLKIGTPREEQRKGKFLRVCASRKDSNKNCDNKTDQFHFIQSDNSFRFQFSLPENEIENTVFTEDKKDGAL